MEEKEKITSQKYWPEEKPIKEKDNPKNENKNIEKEDINLFFKKTLKKYFICIFSFFNFSNSKFYM